MVSTMNSTHEDNKDNEHHMGTVILFLSFSILCACFCKILFSKVLKNKIPLPFTVAVLLLGFIIGIIVSHIRGAQNDFILGELELSEINPHLMYYIFLPLLIFDSSFNGHFHVIKQQLLSAILLAGPGVFIATIIIAICAIYIFPYNWSWLTGLMFGSILSATDPVAVVALLHDSGASRSLASLIDCESLLNDGSAFVLFLIFQNIILTGDSKAKNIIINIIKYSIGGPAFGLACGMISVMLLNRINNELEIEIAATFALSYLVFYIADVELGVSAVLALVAMGLYMSKYKYCISSNVQQSLASAWRIAIFFVNILIFIVTGLILARTFIGIATSLSAKDFGFTILLYIFIHIGRILTIGILRPIMKCTGVNLSWKECIILVWSGLRGSMSLILVLIVSLQNEIDVITRQRFLFHISMIVFLTLVINGTSSKYFVKFLGLNKGTKESEIILLQAFEYMRRQTSWKLSRMKCDEKFCDVDWKMLHDYLPNKLLEELDEENNTNFHQQLSMESEEDLPNNNRCSSNELIIKDYGLRRLSTDQNRVLPVVDIRYTNNNIETINIRNEIVTRFLTAMSIDYEKQWYLGMVRRKTLDILIKSVEQAKEKCSLELHWKLILDQFRLTLFLHLLFKIDSFSLLNRIKNKIFSDHIFRTIELALSFHSAKSRIDNIRVQFPELSNLNQRIVNEVYDEIKTYQLMAMNVLRDLQQSYRICWIIQMTRRCAQMILKYESNEIVQLYETGMLAENEYSHILELIANKLFSLEYGNIKLAEHHRRIIENSFDLIPYFQTLSPIDKLRWKYLLNSEHRWFQPGKILIEKDQMLSKAFLIVRGIVQYENDSMSNYYRCGSIIGIEGLFYKRILSGGTYKTYGGIVETYLIDSNLLNILLSDENLSRSIYSEILLQIIMNNNNYREVINLDSLQMKVLLNEQAKFYKSQSNLKIDLTKDHKLFLLSGTIDRCLNDQEILIQTIDLFHHDSLVTYHLNSSSIVFVWTFQDEIKCLNTRTTFRNSLENIRLPELNMSFYPSFT